MLRSFASKESIRFATVLVDEAAQCMESATLPPLVLGCERLILIGYATVIHHYVHVSVYLCIYVCMYMCMNVCVFMRLFAPVCVGLGVCV